MKVLEIKNSLVKLAYDISDALMLSGFVVIEDENMPYVAQVVNLKADAAGNFAIVKLLFTFNEEGILKNYNGTIPSLKASVSSLPSNELLDVLPIQRPIKLGELAQQDIKLKLDQVLFENHLLICSNKQENTNVLLNNFIKQFEIQEQKCVVFDTDSEFEAENKIVFGQDFKLPLNYETIDFIYENDLDDVDATSKAIIQDIFLELQEYTKTLPEGFIPFDTFLDVVDQQYRETNITQLVLLKNKLLKYRDANVFAQNLKDILNLSIAIEKTNTSVLNIATVSPKLQKEIMKYVYGVMSKIKAPIYSFVKLSNTNSDKKLLKRFIEKDNISTTVVCPHEYKYITELKEISENVIFFAPLTLQNDFAAYNTFLNKLNTDEFIVYGNLTQSIPLIVQLEDIDLDEEDDDDEDEEEDSQNPLSDNIQPVPENIVVNNTAAESDDEEIIIEEPEVEELSIQENIPEPLIEEVEDEDEGMEETYFEPPIIEEQEEELNIEDEPVFEESSAEIIEEPIIEELIQEEPLIEEELPVYSEDDEDIIISSVNDENEDIVEQVAKDVDKVFYEPPEPQISIEEDIEPDVLTEDDLNLIEDLAVEIPQDREVEEEVQADDFPTAEFIEQEEVPPVVPVYPADDIESDVVQTFEAGDAVSHPKYGRGAVEKMIKYGNKTLCSINFEHIGRRLLDPAISEITKL